MIDLSDRKKALLRAIIREHIEIAKPIPSKMVVEKYGFDVSPATIRNDMMELEEAGLIKHPHTSAGRIPTELGYRYFIEHFLEKDHTLTEEAQLKLDELVQAVGSDQPEIKVKTVAKGMAALSYEAVLVELERHSFYYTGISNILRKPEFAQLEEVYSLSAIIDELDGVMEQLSKRSAEDITILVGQDNPVSKQCSLLLTRYVAGDNVMGTMAILGPLRMNYEKNYQLLKYVKTILPNS